MVNFDKFLASFITEIKKYQPVTSYNIPACIKKALEDQGLEYKNGEIVKIQSKVSAESEDEKIRQFLTYAWLEKQGQNKCIDDLTQQEAMDIAVAKCFEQGGQKLIDKVKPKFKVGDWVVLYPSEIEVNRKVVQISRIEKCQLNMYWTTEGTWFGDGTEARLWTIQDAKDGDVLAIDSMPFIYNGSKNEVTVGAYCGFNAKHRFSFAYNYVINEKITPATKEQRDLLFQKMREAGYIFDFEKKELKKLKFKVGDEVIPENEESLTITRIDEEGYWSNDLFICDFDSECICELVEKKSVWKPSNEQVNAFKQAYDWYNTHFAQNLALNSLYNDLKKLEGE